MPNRILFLVSAVLASLASSLCFPILLLPILPDVAHAADDCLAGPDKATPKGGHWRYHLERGTGRKCWYVANETATDDAAKPADAVDPDTTASAPPRPATKIMPSLERAAAAPPDRPYVTKPAPTPSAPATLGPTNNARAEFIDAPRSDQPAPATPAPPPAASGLTPAPAPDASSQQGFVATRWPSPAGMPAADGNSPPAMNPAPVASAQPAVTETQPAADQLAQAPSGDQATAATQPTVAAEGPDYLLYALIIFASSFAVVVGFAGLRFLREWWRDWREETRWRQSQQTYAAYRERSMLAMGEVPMTLASASDSPMPWMRMRRGQVLEQSPEELRERLPEEPSRRIEEEIDEIEQLLALTRQTAPVAQPTMWEAAFAARRGGVSYQQCPPYQAQE